MKKSEYERMRERLREMGMDPGKMTVREMHEALGGKYDKPARKSGKHVATYAMAIAGGVAAKAAWLATL